MKTYFISKAIAIVYNGLEADGTTFARKTCKIKTPIMAKASNARAEALAQVDALAKKYDVPEGGIKILNLEILPISVYETSEEEARKQTSIKVCKLGLLRELKEGQEIKPSLGKYWKLEENGELKLVHFFELSEGEVNPNFREEESTNKWYYIDSNTCLFTGSSKCAKHVAKHKDVWFKFI